MSNGYGFLYRRPWFTHPTRFQALAFGLVQLLLLGMFAVRGTQCFTEPPTFMTCIMAGINVGSLVHIVRRYRATRATCC